MKEGAERNEVKISLANPCVILPFRFMPKRTDIHSILIIGEGFGPTHRRERASGVCRAARGDGVAPGRAGIFNLRRQPAQTGRRGKVEGEAVRQKRLLY